MKYDIIKDFKGSQDGRFAEDFTAGTTVELSDYLAAIVVREGWAKPVAQKEVVVDNKAVITDGVRRGRKAAS